MDHKIIAFIVKLKLYAAARPWRLLFTLIFSILIVVALILPLFPSIIPILLLIFTWLKPTKDNIKMIIKNRKQITFRVIQFFGLYKRPEHHIENRYKRKKKGK